MKNRIVMLDDLWLCKKGLNVVIVLMNELGLIRFVVVFLFFYFVKIGVWSGVDLICLYCKVFFFVVG